MLTLGNVPPLETASINTGRDGKTVDLFNPPYAIANDLPRLSDRTAPVDAVHHNGILEYDARTFLPRFYQFDTHLFIKTIYTDL